MRARILLLLVVIIFLASPFKGTAQVNVQDSLALVDLYNSTNGPGWTKSTNWLTKAPVSTWYGVQITNGRVVELNLFRNQLSGKIPDSFGNLEKLFILELGINKLQGYIPTSFGKLTNLYSLNMRDNQLTGSIPASLCNIQTLSEMYLYNNLLSGNIPDSLGKLSNLTGLSVSNNQLTGKIPASIGKLKKLSQLLLDNNLLTDSIPSSLGNIVNLRELNVQNNKITGPIPSSLGNLKSLGTLLLDHNQLTDTIPASLGYLPTLNYFNLSYNNLRGNIPASFNNLNQIAFGYLQLQNNQLSGEIPLSLTRFAVLNFTLTVRNNKFTFAGLEPVAEAFGYHLSYNHQDSIVINRRENNKLSVSVGGTLANNTFYWYKNGNLDTIIKGDSVYELKSTGLYSVFVNNSIVDKLTLYSKAFQVSSLEVYPTVSKNDSLALVALYNSTNGQYWVNRSGWLNGAIFNWYGVTIENGRITKIDLSYNGLTGKITDSISALTNLETLLLNNNFLSGDFTKYIPPLNKLTSLDISYNEYLFAGLENIDKVFSFAKYSPQKSISLSQLKHTLSSSAGGTLANNTYKLYKNGEVYETQKGDSAFYISDVGTYYINILNSKASKLTLHTDTVVIRVNITDSLALIDLRDSANVRPWAVGSPVRKWGGVQFDTSGKVVRIYLNSLFLNGTIPASISSFSNLKNLDLSNNNLKGGIPASLGNLHDLDTLNLSSNRGIIGEIPSSIGNLPNLTRLDLSVCNLNGPIPSSLGSLTKLTYLDLSYNKLTGEIPASLGGCVNMYRLSLSNNMLTGSIPSSFGNFEKLYLLYLQENQLTGALPASMGNLKQLNGMFLYNNNLTGSIPGSLGNLSSLEYMHLYNNQLSGSIPSTLGKLSKMKELFLYTNKLTGNIPETFGSLVALEKLNLSNNLLSGNIPYSLGNLGINLGSLNLSYNNLTGTIPVTFKKLYKTYSLLLNNNKLSGIIKNFANTYYVIDTYINDNYFNFTDLEGMITTNTWYFHFSPQNNVPVTEKNKMLYAHTGGTLSNNTYNWYKNGTLINTITGDSTLAITGDGSYFAKATNAILSGFALYSDTININSSLIIAPAKPNEITASYEYTAPDGWTHYYFNNNTPNNLTDDTLLLSLKKNGQNIGSIGDGTFAVKLVATAGAGSNTGIKLTNPLITNPTGFYVMNRYWQVTATQQPAASVGVKFYYNNQDLKDVNGSYPTHNLTNDKLIFYKAVGGNPDPTSNLAGATKLISIMPGTQPTDTSWVYHQLSDTTQYGEYSVASFSGGGGGGTGNNKALPITLLNFTGNRSKTDVLLKWQTAQEINTGNYAIERSLNGAYFTGIGNVQAAGNSSVKQSYSYIDANAAALNTTKLYYRLKIVDKDGSFNYSKIISLQNDAINTAYVLYPNPARTSATIQFTASAAAKYTVALTAVNGKVVRRVNIAATTGVNRAVLNVGSLAHGTYIVTITGDKDKQTLTLVKE